MTFVFFLGPEFLSLLEGILEAVSKGVEFLSSVLLSLLVGLSVSLLAGLSLFVEIFLLLVFSSTSGQFEGIQLLKSTLVLKRVLLGLVMEDGVFLDLSEFKLNLIRVDDSGEISAGHNVSGKNVSTLFDSLCSVVTEDSVKGLEGILGPDDESSQMTTWGELEEVKSVNAGSFDTGEVSSSSLNEVVLITVDDEGSLSENVSGVSNLTVSNSNLSGLS